MNCKTIIMQGIFQTDPTKTNYDITGANNSTATGFRLQRYGNEDTKWEATEMYNVGLDATFLNGKFSAGLEWYSKKTTDMLIEAPALFCFGG